MENNIFLNIFKISILGFTGFFLSLILFSFVLHFLEKIGARKEIMKESAPGLLIKASGAVRNLGDAIFMIESGADIIGTSSSVEIMKEVEKIS